MRVTRRIGPLLDRTGVISERRIEEVVSLSWPRIVTGFARMSKVTADFAIVGIVLGPVALAGMSFALAFYGIINQLSLGIAGGTISLVSQAAGDDDYERAGTVITQSLVLAVVTVAPFVVGFYAFSAESIGVLTDDRGTIGYGATYLEVMSFGLIFAVINSVATRSFAAVEDTFTPMLIRIGAAAVNVILSVVFVLVLGLGVFGAALATVLATGLATITLLWGLIGGSYPTRDPLPVRLRIAPLSEQLTAVRQLCSVGSPLVLMNLANNAYIFPLLAIVSVYGPIAVAAFEVSRRIRDVINCPAWGLSIASSTLVGRELGSGNRHEAREFGWDIFRLSMVVYSVIVGIVLLLSTPIARVFVSDPESVAQTAQFIRFAAISALGLGASGAIIGALRGTGDTRWPFYATLVGLYVCTLPTAYLGVVTSLGIVTLYLAIVLEPIVPAGINFVRFRSDAWLER